MAAKRNYIFTNRKHPRKGIMSTVLGIICTCSLALTLYLSYLAKGTTIPRYGTTALLAFIMAIVGLALGLSSRNEPDRFKLFPRLGILLNGITLGVILVITYIAVYVV